MISNVDMQDMNNPWIPIYCNQCQESHKVLTLLGHQYVLTYCNLTGHTLSADDTVRIPRPAHCPLGKDDTGG
jgi:hypothetical protein